MAIDNIESKDNNTGLSEGKKEISEVRDTTSDKTLDIINSKENPYEGMKKVQIEVNGESKELYIDNENLNIDSSDWKEKEINGIKVKINPEGDITEYLDGPNAGEQLFTQPAAEREAKKLGKRLPFTDNKNKEFQAIIEKIGIQEFMKVYPGYRFIDGSDFGEREDYASFWSASTVEGDYAFNRIFNKEYSKIQHYKGGRYCINMNYGLSVRLVKDID